MKIAILGYSGSGKSTTAKKLGDIYNIPVMHMDTVYWAENWQERNIPEAMEIVRRFMAENNSWIIDGNYKKMYQAERLENADMIIFMNFNRFVCFGRALKRYIKYKGKSRPDITQSCNEKFDFEFMKWILWQGRTKEKRADYTDMCKRYKNKTFVLRNQRQLDDFLKNAEKS